METLIDSNSHQIAEPFTPVHTLCATRVNQNWASMTTPRCEMLGRCDAGFASARARASADIRQPRLYYAPVLGDEVYIAVGFKVTSKLIITIAPRTRARPTYDPVGRARARAKRDKHTRFQSDRLISWRAPFYAVFWHLKISGECFDEQVARSRRYQKPRFPAWIFSPAIY